MLVVKRAGRSILRAAMLTMGLWATVLPARAIVFNPDRFDLGQPGLPADVLGALRLERLAPIDGATVEARLAVVSRAAPFLPVGRLRLAPSGRVCTATWLGERDGVTFLLTAAHCLRPLTAAELPMLGGFQGWDGATLAHGAGVAYVPDAAVGSGAFVEEAVDIAVVRLPTVAAALDPDGSPQTPPVLYDGQEEAGSPVDIVGYGRSGGTDPAPGFKRQWGRMGALQVDRRSLLAWRRRGAADQWAETSSGDSGSAWWQRHAGRWSIVGITCCGSRADDPVNEPTGDAAGARVSRHVAWLSRVVPGLRTVSDAITVTEARPYVSPDPEEGLSPRRVFFTITAQEGVMGPAAVLWSGTLHASRLQVTVTDASTGAHLAVSLRAQRDLRCELKRHWAYPNRCTGKTLGPLVVSFHVEDNPQLLPGDWRARFEIEAASPFDTSYRERLPVLVHLRR